MCCRVRVGRPNSQGIARAFSSKLPITTGVSLARRNPVHGKPDEGQSAERMRTESDTSRPVRVMRGTGGCSHLAVGIVWEAARARRGEAAVCRARTLRRGVTYRVAALPHLALARLVDRRRVHGVGATHTAASAGGPHLAPHLLREHAGSSVTVVTLARFPRACWAGCGTPFRRRIGCRKTSACPPLRRRSHASVCESRTQAGEARRRCVYPTFTASPTQSRWRRRRLVATPARTRGRAACASTLAARQPCW